MPLYVCDNCHAIENTACGHYWGATGAHRWFKDAALDRKRLCSECTPTEYHDGSKTGRGQWHNHFPKEIATPERIEQMGRNHFVHTAGL